MGQSAAPTLTAMQTTGAAGGQSYLTVPGTVSTVPGTTATMSPPTFDGFSTQPAATPPPVLQSPPTAFGSYGTANPVTVTPGAAAPPGQYPGYPGYPAQPATVYPGWQPSTVPWPQVQTQSYMSLFNDRYTRWTWVYKQGSDDLGTNDIDLGITMNIPNFLWTQQPLRVTPVFIFHFWDGPSSTTADLPSRAYSALVDLSWMSPPDHRIGSEFSFAAGVYSDFSRVEHQSVRYTGVGLGWVKLSPNLTFKIGAEYLDRVNVHLLPAIGLFWQPNPDTRLDIYFPRPKLARRLSQLGNTEVWFYGRGEYGGGSWTIERASPTNGLSGFDQVDINDTRVALGFEWKTLSNTTGFLEAGYVFDRELVYRYGTPGKYGLKDTFMLSAGWAF